MEPVQARVIFFRLLVTRRGALFSHFLFLLDPDSLLCLVIVEKILIVLTERKIRPGTSS